MSALKNKTCLNKRKVLLVTATFFIGVLLIGKVPKKGLLLHFSPRLFKTMKVCDRCKNEIKNDYRLEVYGYDLCSKMLSGLQENL
jgi:hypothetical protein